MTADVVTFNVSSATVGNSQAVPSFVASTSNPAKKLKIRKKKSQPNSKAVSSHPAYSNMVKKAILDLKDRKGSSKAAILKYVIQHYKVGDNVVKINAHVRLSLKRGVTTGSLKQVKGTGASGSFRLGKNHTKIVTPKKKKIVKKAAKKPIIISPNKKTNSTTKRTKVVKKVTLALHSHQTIVGKKTATVIKPVAAKKTKISVGKKDSTKSAKKSITAKAKK